MGSEHVNSLGRNEPCWCGSGQKYKRCHLAADETAHRGARQAERVAAGEASDDHHPSYDRGIDKRLVGTIGFIALAALVGVSILRSFGDGLIVGAAVVIAGTAYAILRDPPPRRSDAGDPAALNFGVDTRSPPVSGGAEPSGRPNAPAPPAPPRTRRKPR